MSYNLPSKSAFDAPSFPQWDALLSFAGETAAERAAEERVVDCKLRNVRLPDGLLTRLGALVYSLPDESADQADWLGC